MLREVPGLPVWTQGFREVTGPQGPRPHQEISPLTSHSLHDQGQEVDARRWGTRWRQQSRGCARGTLLSLRAPGCRELRPPLRLPPGALAWSLLPQQPPRGPRPASLLGVTLARCLAGDGKLASTASCCGRRGGLATLQAPGGGCGSASHPQLLSGGQGSEPARALEGPPSRCRACAQDPDLLQVLPPPRPDGPAPATRRWSLEPPGGHRCPPFSCVHTACPSPEKSWRARGREGRRRDRDHPPRWLWRRSHDPPPSAGCTLCALRVDAAHGRRGGLPAYRVSDPAPANAKRHGCSCHQTFEKAV